MYTGGAVLGTVDPVDLFGYGLGFRPAAPVVVVQLPASIETNLITHMLRHILIKMLLNASRL